MDRVGTRRVTEAKRRLLRRLGDEIRSMRLDAGVSQAAVARGAGINQAWLSRIEAGRGEPSLEILTRIGMALGADLSVRFFANTGPRLRDHLSAAMGTELTRSLGQPWRLAVEVAVYRPVRGVIDVLLEERHGHQTVVTEIHSQLHRAEQQVRWQGQKADALALMPEQVGRSVSRLLVLRNTQANRDATRAAEGLLGAAYPASTAAAVEALRGHRTWPGSAVIWMDVQGGVARLLDGPPRGVPVGR